MRGTGRSVREGKLPCFRSKNRGVTVRHARFVHASGWIGASQLFREDRNGLAAGTYVRATWEILWGEYLSGRWFGLRIGRHLSFTNRPIGATSKSQNLQTISEWEIRANRYRRCTAPTRNALTLDTLAVLSGTSVHRASQSQTARGPAGELYLIPYKALVALLTLLLMRVQRLGRDLREVRWWVLEFVQTVP